MDIYEYLPQLIVAYDGNDKFANLIHVKKASLDKDYYCPCCSGIVKPRALDSNKEQSHYYHKTGKCTKESQLHFFCKNWLFETGSRFYINDELFEVSSIDIEQSHYTPFGDYRPDITVYTTCGKIIYFEMFFTNRKTGDDYFCKWDFLGNSVVEVNIKEYVFKIDTSTIPTFTYLYNNGVCYSKPYVKRDLYVNTIARIKHELTRQKVLNYKARIEQLDWFWQELRNNTRDSILDTLSNMEYEDMVSCYEIIKRKQCVSYLKEDVLTMINQKVISNVRESLKLPTDKNIFFDLEHIRGRTYEAGIRLDLTTEHIFYNKLFSLNYYNFNQLKDFPKIVFSKNVFSLDEINIPENEISQLLETYEYVLKHKNSLLKLEEELSIYEKDLYKIKMKNDLYTVLIKKDKEFDILFEERHLSFGNDINALTHEIDLEKSNKDNKLFLEKLFNTEEYRLFQSDIKKYNNIDISLNIYTCINQECGFPISNIILDLIIAGKSVYNDKLKPNMNDFLEKKNTCALIIQNFIISYSTLLSLIDKINNCKNKFWKANFYFDYWGVVCVELDQNIFIPKRYTTFEKVRFKNLNSMSENDMKELLKKGIYRVMDNMQVCGYRIMEVRDEE